jgi:hypothetical protein
VQNWSCSTLSGKSLMMDLSDFNRRSMNGAITLRRRSAAAASRWTWIGVTKAACRVNEAGQAQHQRILHRPLAVPHRGKCLGCHENLHEPESRNIAKMNTWAIQRPMRKPLPADGLEVAVMAVSMAWSRCRSHAKS